MVSIDIGSVQPICIFKDNFRVISLDTLAIALLGQTHSIMFLDDRIAVYTPNRLSLFDGSGNYLRDIGQRGLASGEFITLSSVFYKNNVFGLFDVGGQRILKFDADGIFIDTKGFDMDSEHDGVQRIIPFFDGYAALLRYRGQFVETPTFGRFDRNLNLKEAAEKQRVSGGLSLYQPLSLFQNELLYWNMFDYTIYSIDENFVVQEKYFINFGRYSIPSRIIQSNDVDRIFEYIQENLANVVISIHHVVEEESFLSFIFNVGYDLYLAILNKYSDDTKIYKLELPNFTLYSFMTIHNGYYVLCGVDMQNPYSNLEIIFIRQDLLR